MDWKWVVHLGSGELQAKTNVDHEELVSEEPRWESLKSRESTQVMAAFIIYQHQERKSQTAKEELPYTFNSSHHSTPTSWSRLSTNCMHGGQLSMEKMRKDKKWKPAIATSMSLPPKVWRVEGRKWILSMVLNECIRMGFYLRVDILRTELRLCLWHHLRENRKVLRPVQEFIQSQRKITFTE